MIRVLQIVNSLSKDDGSQNMVMNYYRAINRGKIQFDFAYFFDSNNTFKNEIEEMGGKIFKLEKPSIKDFLNPRKYSHLFEKKGYQIIHCHPLFAVALFSKLAKKKNIKIIAHSHASELGNGILRKMRNYYFVKMSSLKSDYRFADSRSAGVFMFGKKSFSVINCAFQLDKYFFNENTRSSIRESLGIPNDSFVVGHVGGLDLSKNHGFLVDVFIEINKIINNSYLILIGGNRSPESETIRSSINKKMEEAGLLSRLRLLGTRSDANELLSAMDVFVFPSYNEGLGMSLVEAQINGLSCFASDSLPDECRCSKKASFLALKEGACSWADAITSNRILDREICLDDFADFNINDQCRKLENLYFGILRDNNKSGDSHDD